MSVFCNASGGTNRFTLNWVRSGTNGPAFGAFNQSQFQVVAALVEIILEPGDGIFLNSGSASAQFIATLFGSERTL